MQRLLFSSSLLLALMVFDSAALARQSDEKRVVGYFAGWGEASAADIRADLLTHVIYAFGRIRDGRCILTDEPAATAPANAGATTQRIPEPVRKVLSLKERNPRLKTLVSLGGWGGSAPFSDLAMTEESRRTFARSCAAAAHEFGFDGIDIDWEYPGGGGMAKGRPQDTRNFTLLLAEIRRQLDEQGAADGKRYLLTIATPASPEKFGHIELDKVSPLVDFINLMTYDFSGGWSPVTSFNAQLFAADANESSLSVDSSVRGYLAVGVPKEKLVVGVPFYGRAFGGVDAAGDGLFQKHDRKAPRPPSGDEWTYRNLVGGNLLDGKTFARHWHDKAMVPWLYDPRSHIMVTYDDPQSILKKAQYARDNGLGGVMIWELSQDDADSSLLRAVNEGLKP